MENSEKLNYAKFIELINELETKKRPDYEQYVPIFVGSSSNFLR